MLAAYRPALFLITGVAPVGVLVALAGLRRTADVVQATQPVAQPVARVAGALDATTRWPDPPWLAGDDLVGVPG